MINLFEVVMANGWSTYRAMATRKSGRDENASGNARWGAYLEKRPAYRA